MLHERKRILGWAGVIILALLIPLIGTQVSAEINWDTTDFLVLGGALCGVAVVYEAVIRKSVQTVYRAAFLLAIAGALLLTWVNGAVGIIGNESQDVNLLFGGVVLAGMVGAWITRTRAAGMSVTMYIMAALQMLVPAVALIIWPPASISWSPGVPGVFLLCGFFALVFAVSAVLFKRASDQHQWSG